MRLARRRSWVWALFAILLPGAAWVLFGLSAGKPKPTIASVSGHGTASGDKPSSTAPRTSVRGFGRIEPGQGIVQISAPSDYRLLRLKVGEGQVVKARDVLAHLDTRPEALAEVSHARSQLASARERLSAETANGEAKRREAEVHRGWAKGSASAPILKMGDAANMYAGAEVYESDVRQYLIGVGLSRFLIGNSAGLMGYWSLF